MAVSLSELKKFIKGILKDADLTKLSSKMIRRQCEEEFDTELSAQKQIIDKLIMSCIDENAEEENNGNSSRGSDSESSSSSSSEESESEVEEIKPKVVTKAKKTQSNKNSSSVPVKKRALPQPKKKIVAKKAKVTQRSKSTVKKQTVVKREKSPESSSSSDLEVSEKVETLEKAEESEILDDAAIARQLQDEEWNFRRRAVKKVPNKKKNTNTNSNPKPKSRKANSSYSRKCALSESLSAVMNETEMARHDVVKRMWEIVRERDLFDPKNKQYVICDEQLQKVFGKKRIRMFGIMKYLKNHVKDLN